MPDLYWSPGDPLDGPERWYPLRDFEGVYEASTDGRIRRIAGGRGVKGKMPRLMSMPPNSEGYLTVRLCVDGKAKTHNAHVLIALTFHGDPPEEIMGDPQVDHINDDPSDCRPINLMWLSRYANLQKEHDKAAYEAQLNYVEAMAHTERT